MSSDGYDRMLELVAENPALTAEEFAELATEEVSAYFPRALCIDKVGEYREPDSPETLLH